VQHPSTVVHWCVLVHSGRVLHHAFANYKWSRPHQKWNQHMATSPTVKMLNKVAEPWQESCLLSSQGLFLVSSWVGQWVNCVPFNSQCSFASSLQLRANWGDHSSLAPLIFSA
jgi:hypothetical protein